MHLDDFGHVFGVSTGEHPCDGDAVFFREGEDVRIPRAEIGVIKRERRERVFVIGIGSGLVEEHDGTKFGSVR